MTAAPHAHGSELPRWVAVTFAVLGLLAIGTGMRARPASPVATNALHEAADTTFAPYRGFMMDSLRRGRLRADSVKAAEASGAASDTGTKRYSPRSCMPE